MSNTLSLSLLLSAGTVLALFFIALPAAYIFSYSRSKIISLIETVFLLPMILPPTVLGFYLLLFYSSPLFRDVLHIRPAFSFSGILFSSILFSLPLMTSHLKTGFDNISRSLLTVSYSLGKSKTETFLRIQLPLLIPSIITGSIMTFVHTIGAFGIILMTGGNIPGQTRTLSIDIYENVETMNYQAAHKGALLLLCISMAAMITARYLFKQGKNLHALH